MEEVRLALLSSEQAVAHLAALLGHAEEWVRTAAAAALGNLAACRSDFQDAAPQVQAAGVRDAFVWMRSAWFCGGGCWFWLGTCSSTCGKPVLGRLLMDACYQGCTSDCCPGLPAAC